MEIRIGIRNITREITLESNESAADVAAAVERALAGSVLDLTDSKGRRVLVPSTAIGYVELGVEEKRRVGFGG